MQIISRWCHQNLPKSRPGPQLQKGTTCLEGVWICLSSAVEQQPACACCFRDTFSAGQTFGSQGRLMSSHFARCLCRGSCTDAPRSACFAHRPSWPSWLDYVFSSEEVDFSLCRLVQLPLLGCRAHFCLPPTQRGATPHTSRSPPTISAVALGSCPRCPCCLDALVGFI